ncbi:T9SS type A sorting domain-containing protein [candidate division WOR-3 bacterium]|nr:T9SS type A sorting domain-containing protein [candidate division WOR-3 bacterium]
MVFIVALCITVSATVINIPDDYSTIQEGIDASSDGDTVLVQPDTYVENINFNGHNIVLGSLFLTTGDTSYISSTIIDGGSSGSVVTFENGEDSTTIITGFTLQNGYSWKGGGIRCDSSSPSLTNLTISGNTAEGIMWQSGCGGGIYCFNSNPSLIDVTISVNTAFNESCGGGIYCSNSSPSLTNVIISENTADYGGGICCIFNPSLDLTNVTITGNTIGGYGGGIYCNFSNLSLVNCILWNDIPQEVYFFRRGSPSSITVSYSDIQGDSAGIVTNNNGTVYWLDGNIALNPLFIGSGNHPFSLQEESPCIDTGNPDTSGLNLPPWDIVGNERIWDGDGDEIAIIDMGAYEYGAPLVGIDDSIALKPTTCSLLQNYPNPSNSQTTIQYSLTLDSKVVLKVYNTLAQEIKVLVDKFQSSGIHQVIWDGRNNLGRTVPCGIYFLKFTAREYTETQKLIKVK